MRHCTRIEPPIEQSVYHRELTTTVDTLQGQQEGVSMIAGFVDLIRTIVIVLGKIKSKFYKKI